MWGYYFGFWGGGLTNFPHFGVLGILVGFGIRLGGGRRLRADPHGEGFDPASGLDECFGLISPNEAGPVNQPT